MTPSRLRTVKSLCMAGKSLFAIQLPRMAPGLITAASRARHAPVTASGFASGAWKRAWSYGSPNAGAGTQQMNRRHFGIRPNDRHCRRADRVRAGLRSELGRALVPDPGVHRQQESRNERGDLLHGERVRTVDGHGAVRIAVSIRAKARNKRRRYVVPARLGRIRPRRRPTLDRLARDADREGRGEPV
jgi:hypothetical protein